MIFVRCQLCDANANLRLSFLAVFRQFRKEHNRKRGRVLQSFLDLDAVALVALGDQFLPHGENPCAIIVQIGIDLLTELVLAGRPLFGLVSFIGRNRTLDIDLF